MGTTVDDLVGSLDEQVATDATISETTLHGRSWVRVDLVEAPGVDRGTCRHGADGPLQIWADPAETDYYALAPDVKGTVLITEADGDRVVLITATNSRASATDVAELEGIIASLQLVD